MSTNTPHIDTHLNLEAVKALKVRVDEKWGETITATLAVREVTLHVSKKDIITVLTWLRDEPACAFTQVMDITAVDWLGHPTGTKERFEIVYHLLSPHNNLRVRVKVKLNDTETVPTSVPVWPAANWFEREVWDMFGIGFDGHPDLRRILTDYGFDGHPLRKDFPLTGHVEVYYDEAEKRVAYKPVDLPQEFRRFDKQSPWEKMLGDTAGLADANNDFKREEFK